VWLVRLPEMRLAYLEATFRPAEGGVADTLTELWESFNEWRLKTRPALGRIDISAMAWALPRDDGSVGYRLCLPVRGDYQPLEPARSTFFPGGSFAYAYADNVDEVEAAGAAVEAWVAERGYQAVSGPIEVHKYHYNLEQHPCDCGYLVLDRDGNEPVPAGGSHASPLPIAR
jgi:hypothetical protein